VPACPGCFLPAWALPGHHGDRDVPRCRVNLNSLIELVSNQDQVRVPLQYLQLVIQWAFATVCSGPLRPVPSCFLCRQEAGVMSPGLYESRWLGLIRSLLAFFLSGEATVVHCLKTFVLSHR